MHAESEFKLKMRRLAKQRARQVRIATLVLLAITAVALYFWIVYVRKESAHEPAQDRALVRAIERQANAQEEQAAALKAIERHLRDIAAAGGR